MVCFILPAHLLIELAEAGNVDVRDTIPTLLASAALSRVIAAQLFEVNPLDPWLYTLVGCAIGAVGLFAATAPALRAAGVNPIEALRA